jgi:hypothetical protein
MLSQFLISMLSVILISVVLPSVVVSFKNSLVHKPELTGQSTGQLSNISGGMFYVVNYFAYYQKWLA